MFEHVPKHQQPIGYQNVNLIDLTHVRGGGETYPPSHYVVYLDDDEIRRHFEGILQGDIPMLTNTEDLEVSKAVREVRYGCMLLLLNYFFRLTVIGTEVKDGMTMGHGRDVLSCIENTLDDLEVEMDENTQGIIYEMTSAMLRMAMKTGSLMTMPTMTFFSKMMLMISSMLLCDDILLVLKA